MVTAQPEKTLATNSMRRNIEKVSYKAMELTKKDEGDCIFGLS